MSANSPSFTHDSSENMQIVVSSDNNEQNKEGSIIKRVNCVAQMIEKGVGATFVPAMRKAGVSGETELMKNLDESNFTTFKNLKEAIIKSVAMEHANGIVRQDVTMPITRLNIEVQVQVFYDRIHEILFTAFHDRGKNLEQVLTGMRVINTPSDRTPYEITKSESSAPFHNSKNNDYNFWEELSD